MNTKTKKIAFVGIMASLAMILSYVELLIPPIFTSLPGIKMGLPNIVIIFTLYKFGVKEAAAVSAIRLLCVSLLFGNAMIFAYSLAGAFLSLALMSILKCLDVFSAVGVSIVGGISHNAGQIIVAILMLQRIEIGYYMIALSISGTIAGILVGLAGSYLLKLLKKITF